MATTTIDLHGAPKGVLSKIGSAFVGVMEFFYSVSAAGKCAHEVERLMAFTDRELQERGIEREDIVRHAFQRYMHYR